MNVNLVTTDAGHNCYPDTGAASIKVEDVLTKEVVALINSKLKEIGKSVVDCTPYGARFNSVNGSLAFRVKHANANGSDLHLCIHFNCGGGNGVECYISGRGGNSEKVASAICTEISALGYQNRGVKVASFYVPKYTNMPCVLVEVSFVDSRHDMEKYDANDIATAIVKAVTGQTVGGGSTTTTPQVTPPQQTIRPDNGIVPNAVVVFDDLYIRDASGRRIYNGIVNIGDKVKVLDVLYGKQLVLMDYPTANGTRREYTKNVVKCIDYMYDLEWQNGSTPEPVYQDSACTQRIGSLSPWEKATPLYRKNGHLHVVYNTDKGQYTKSGFVKYDGGFSKF